MFTLTTANRLASTDLMPRNPTEQLLHAALSLRSRTLPPAHAHRCPHVWSLAPLFSLPDLPPSRLPLAVFMRLPHSRCLAFLTLPLDLFRGSMPPHPLPTHVSLSTYHLSHMASYHISHITYHLLRMPPTCRTFGSCTLTRPVQKQATVKSKTRCCACGWSGSSTSFSQSWTSPATSFRK